MPCPPQFSFRFSVISDSVSHDHWPERITTQNNRRTRRKPFIEAKDKDANADADNNDSVDLNGLKVDDDVY